MLDLSPLMSDLISILITIIMTGGSLKGGAGMQWLCRVSWGCEYPCE